MSPVSNTNEDIVYSDADISAQEGDVDRKEMLKAHVFSRERQQSRAMANVDEVERAFVGVGAIEPPYNPATLVTLLEHSNALRQNIDAYVTNIDAFGHRFEPVLDLDAADADDRLRAYILDRRGLMHPDIILDPTRQIPAPSDDSISRCKAELREKMRAEKERLTQFFDFASLDISFVTLRRRTRQDIEAQGNGYWEVMRSSDGRICGFEYVPAFTVRHMPLDHTPQEVCVPVKSGDFTFDHIEVTKHFRRYVQVLESRVVYFKEFGDRRLLGANTGAYFKCAEDMVKAGDRPATEMLHFRIHSPKSSYGVPRWIGTLISVLGSRQSEEVNLAYFENKSIPPLAITVSGGRITNQTVERIQDYIDNKIKGKSNFHKILVLEAESNGMPGLTGDSGRTKIEFKPLTGAQNNDALFQNYDERNIDKVGQAFRLPRMLRGDIRDFNRSTAEAALEFAEMQVFAPERDEFDFLVNRKLFPALGIRFWKFKSAAPVTTNAKDLAEIVGLLMEKNVLTPAEAREISEKIFNRELRRIDAPWVRQPVALTIAGIVPPGDLAAPGMVSPQVAAHGDQLGGAAMNQADQPGFAATATEPTGSGNKVELTGTLLGTIITVNEARAEYNKSPLKKPDGTNDPDGFLTIAEFEAKRTSRGQALGQEQGQAAAVAPGAADKRDPDLSALAHGLLSLRKTVAEAEQQEATTAFNRAKDLHDE